MKAPRAPHLDERRTEEFSAELGDRAQAWIPLWALADSERDFGRALLQVAARFSSEVAERLDRAGDKMRRGFLDWLGVPRKAARPARVPVVFKLADAAQEAVLATAPVQMQADAGGTPVVFETEQDLRIVPGWLGIVVGVDAAEDAFYLPPPGLADLQPLVPQPTQWQLKSFAAAGATKLQLDPATGLTVDMIIAAGGAQYLITEPKPDNGIVTIDPPLDSELPESTVITRVANFAPFEGAARNRQEHALYLGHMELLNIEAAATIDVVGANSLATGIKWQYWGKVKGSDQPDWQPLNIAPVDDQKADALVLMKPEGSVDPKKIGELNSRWIRASVTKVEGEASLLRVDALQIRVNCKKDFPTCPKPADQDEPSIVPEAMANTTPLVLDNVFSPLGKEPRQFDAFYLGSQEAFSKKAAKVQLCFEMADPTFFALSAVRDGVFANSILAGVAKDRALHLLTINRTTGAISKYRDLEPLQPPMPGYDGKAETGPAVALDQPFRTPGPSKTRSYWRPPVWAETDQQFFGFDFSGFLVAMSAGDAIWVWHEHSFDRHKSGWISFGSIPATTPPATDEEPVAGLVYLEGSPAKIVALRNGQMAVRDWPDGTNWKGVETRDSANHDLVRFEALVPVLDEANRFATSVANGMIGVSATNFLYKVSFGPASSVICTKLMPTNVDSGVRPVAVLNSTGELLIAFTKTSLRDLVMFHQVHGEATITLKETNATVVGFDVATSSTGLHFFASVLHGEEGYLASWAPQKAPVATIGYSSATIPMSLGTVGGAPTEVSNHIVVPGTHGNSFIAEFDPSKRFEGNATILPGIVLPSSAPTLVLNDFVMRMTGANPEAHRITDYGVSKEGEVFYPIEAAFSAGVTGPLLAYKASTPLAGNTLAPNKLKLQLGDHEATVDSFVLINGNFHKITALNQNASRWVATVTPNVASGTASYSRPVPTAGHTTPYMSLDATNNNWDAGLLKRVQLLLPGADPEQQAGKAFSTDATGHPLLIVLEQEFATSPPGNPTFIVDATVGEWSQNQEDASANPELSWEYWNGKSWSKLLVKLDDTQNLKTTGALQFDVPDDIASSDWAGKTNFWIRARLIGGDYGREKVTAKTKTVGDTTEQTIERSTEGIRAPSVLKLEISYRVCDPVLPTVVLTDDSGSRIDQSDANRTGSAIVEAFVPLSLTLARLSSAKSSAETTSDCPPDYDCQKALKPAATVPTASTATPANPETPASQRSLFVGLAATPSEAPVNVLLLVEERDHTIFAPLTIEALVANRFEKIVSNDATRALGESGLLTMTFAIPPTPSDLFGQSGLTWLRLTPEASASGEWKPVLRGAYLNAVWASATETLTRELLGSSDGAPNMVVRLARPPVLDATLELRVKEPLDEQERAQFLKANPASVVTEVSAIDGRTSDWVVWKQVVDPNYEPPDARVYSLDESKGEIRFGDGQHGLIPPIGRDSIVAIKYKRTEPGSTTNNTVPGNLVTSRTALNLVSPVATVESVIAADQAAGGAPPEDDDRVLRFGYSRLRHRDRAITLLDLEDLTAESSPDIAQAHAIARQGSVRLVVLMRGKNPTPNAAQRRELRRYLLDKAPISLGMPNALRITGPHIRRLRLDLTLRVTSLDKAGSVGNWVKEKLEHFFDTSTGGIDGDGWLLGANPLEDDVTFALLDAPDLESIKSVKRYEIADDGSEELWSALLKPTELAMLDEDPLRIHFETVEEPI